MREQDRPLLGRTVGITAERKATEMGALLQRRGAEVRYGAAMHTVPVPQDGDLLAATESVLAAPVHQVVAMTGAGFRGWLEAAAHHGLHDRLVRHLSGAELLARGAKARGALRGAGLVETWTSPTEESAEILERLLTHDPHGQRIVLQLHGDAMHAFRDALGGAGAEVLSVPVYRWTDPVDLAALDALIDDVITGGIDVLPLTSAPAATNLLGRADRTGKGVQLRGALRERVFIACVGPVTAAPIAAEDLPHEMPDRARTAALVRLIADRFTPD